MTWKGSWIGTACGLYLHLNLYSLLNLYLGAATVQMVSHSALQSVTVMGRVYLRFCSIYGATPLVCALWRALRLQTPSIRIPFLHSKPAFPLLCTTWQSLFTSKGVTGGSCPNVCCHSGWLVRRFMDSYSKFVGTYNIINLP